jgi:hypothetical protein
MFTSDELYEIRTSLGERLGNKEERLKYYQGLGEKDSDDLEMIESLTKDISDIKSALEKIKVLSA